jgi:hypothetical protein
MPTPPKQTIFISHSSMNGKVTEELYHALTGRFRLDCWMDNFDLHTDRGPFSAQIVNALRVSSMLVLVDSPAARASDYVTREMQAAKDLQKPIQRCSIAEDQPALLRKLKIGWLALTIQLRLARGFVFAALSLFLLLAVLAGGIFWLGTRVVPVMAQSVHDLPGAFRPTPTITAVPTPSDPKVAASFHFKPNSVILQDDFLNPAIQNSFSDPMFPNPDTPRDPNVKISQQNGSLVMFFPGECMDKKLIDDCDLRLYSNVLDAKAIQYFGLRARTTERTYLRGIMVSLSVSEPSSSGTGFGWYLTDRAMAFFHSIQDLPEKDSFAFVPIDMGWHAYEILRDPQKFSYYYYIDGQLVDTYTPVHGSEWDQAPLQLSIYSIGNKVAELNGNERIDTQFEIDELVMGGFTSR